MTAHAICNHSMQYNDILLCVMLFDLLYYFLYTKYQITLPFNQITLESLKQV